MLSKAGGQRRAGAVAFALAAAIAVTAAMLGQVPPLSALAERAGALCLAGASRPERYSVALADRGIAAFIVVEPGRSGRNHLRLDLADAGDRPLDAGALKLTLANAALGIAPTERDIAAVGPGVYEISDLAIPAAGTWTLSIVAPSGVAGGRIVTTEVPIR
jgi:copper transport protein